MLKLEYPKKEHKEKYIEMINEWKNYGGPYVPCIVEYDCENEMTENSYDCMLNVVEEYRNGKIAEYDVEYFESSDFLFIFDDDELVGVGEVRHNLKELGKNTIGHIACGIRPSKRKQGYALKATELMIDYLNKDDIDEVILCHYEENKISPKIINNLGFTFRNSTISKVSKKEIKCYIKGN